MIHTFRLVCCAALGVALAGCSEQAAQQPVIVNVPASGGGGGGDGTAVLLAVAGCGVVVLTAALVLAACAWWAERGRRHDAERDAHGAGTAAAILAGMDHDRRPPIILLQQASDPTQTATPASIEQRRRA